LPRRPRRRSGATRYSTAPRAHPGKRVRFPLDGAVSSAPLERSDGSPPTFRGLCFRCSCSLPWPRRSANTRNFHVDRRRCRPSCTDVWHRHAAERKTRAAARAARSLGGLYNRGQTTPMLRPMVRIRLDRFETPGGEVRVVMNAVWDGWSPMANSGKHEHRMVRRAEHRHGAGLGYPMWSYEPS